MPSSRDVPSVKQRVKDARAILKAELPDEVTGIPIAQTAQAIHFLHTSIDTYERPGTVVARYVVHYEGGDTEEIQVVLGAGIEDFTASPSDQKGAWNTRNLSAQISAGNDHRRAEQPTHVMRQSWENPHPEKTISTIDLISAKKQAAVIVLGINLE